MSLRPGDRLGPYEVQSLIGAGGMGEVYKARDTRLDRTVAIKVLPPDVASDPDRRARFAREAKVISQLSHPHICALYDVGDGSSEEAEGNSRPPYLVMEHLEGETLAARLERGALPLDQALRLGAEIADALAYAHRHDIVHRDLKPGNVMLTGSGVKLLDFGLAKLRSGDRLQAAGSRLTATEGLTTEGTVLGTLPYMAPEQVEGKDTDARTDIFALGCVLYEIVTGRLAFAGETSAALMSAILKDEPPPLAERQPLATGALDHVVRTCLAKDPEERWQSVADITRQLVWIGHQPQARTSESDGAGAAIGGTGSSHVSATIGATLLVAISVVVTATLLRLYRPSPSPSAVVRSVLAVNPADELNAGGTGLGWSPTPGGSRTALAWTPEGRALVFVGRRGGAQQLYVRELDRGEAKALAGTEGAQNPAVSPDGRWVAFWSGGKIAKVPLAGGPPVVVSGGLSYPPVGMSWTATGDLVYANADDGALWRVSSAGGRPTVLTKRLPEETQHILPHVLPGDAAVLYAVRKREYTWGDEEIVAQTLTTGVRTTVLGNAVDARYAPSGHLLFLRQGTLFALPFDVEGLEVRGNPVPLIDGVAQVVVSSNTYDLTGAGQFSVSPTGALAYVTAPPVSYPASTIVAVDRQGTAEPLPARPRPYGPQVRLSPDGRHLAVDLRDEAERSLWLFDLARGTLAKLTSDGEANRPAWTPDGKRIAFKRSKEGTPKLFWQRVDQNTPPELFLKEDMEPAEWSADGRELLLVKEEGATDIWVASVGGSEPTLRPLVQSPAREEAPVFSPDGRVLAYQSDASGRPEVYVQPYRGSGPRIQVSVDGGASPAWNPRRAELFFVQPENEAPTTEVRLMAVNVRTAPVLSVERPRPLFTFEGLRDVAFICMPVRCYDVDREGQHFFAVRRSLPPPSQPVTHITLVQNWFEELKAKVPTGR